jgi:CBS domain-containing protein
MLSNNLVSAVMNRSITPIQFNHTLGQATEVFKKTTARHLPVLRNNEVIGMIGKSDIERVVAAYLFCVENSNVNPNALECVPVSKVMSREPVHIQATQTLEEAAEILTERAFRALPVLDGDDLVGVISTTDLMQYVVHEMNASGVFI